jgi:predicted HTH transcriptional regulator
MANNKGGQIIFGIKDSPHIPEGLKNDKFISCDPKIVNEKMLEFFSHVFEWNIDVIEYDSKQFGQLWTPESTTNLYFAKRITKNVNLERVRYISDIGEKQKKLHILSCTNLSKQKKKKKRNYGWISKNYNCRTKEYSNPRRV